MVMNQQKKYVVHAGQFEYLGRWVDKRHFRAFVYNIDGGQLLAKSYEEYIKLTSSGIWFDSKESALAPKAIAEADKVDEELDNFHVLPEDVVEDAVFESAIESEVQDAVSESLGDEEQSELRMSGVSRDEPPIEPIPEPEAPKENNRKEKTRFQDSFRRGK